MMHNAIDPEFELHAYVDGDLDEEAMARVEAYLSNHPETATKVRDYLQQKDDLRSFAHIQTSADEPQALRALANSLARRLRHGNLFPWRRAMVVTLLFAGGWLGHIVYMPLVEGPVHVDEMLQAHLLLSEDPTEILPISPERIKKLFLRIDEIGLLPDLRQFDLEPIGAQLLAGNEGMVLHVPYRDSSSKVVSYFVQHDNEGAEEPQQTLNRQGVSMITWTHESSRYAIAAELDVGELSRIASSLDYYDDDTDPSRDYRTSF